MLSNLRMGCIFALLCATSVALRAQTFQIIAGLAGFQGGEPRYASLVQGPDGNLYGTASMLGLWGEGTIFEVSTGGAVSDLYNFCNRTSCSTGYGPEAGLVLGRDGNFYGTAQYGGDATCGCGTVFSITRGGHLTTLHTFINTDGRYPAAALIEARDGSFYGTTMNGGTYGFGTIYKITPGGMFTTLHNFNSSDGASPHAPLILATDGNFYGTTLYGGYNKGCVLGCGTVFKMTPGGSLVTIHRFHPLEGATPYAALIQAADGNFYGTTSARGGSASCMDGCGTVFKLSLSGVLTVLHMFEGYPLDGGGSTAPLIQATDGNFYGTTGVGGNNSACDGCGTIFEMTPAGTLSILHNFDYYTDGDDPTGGLVQASDGILYGTTTYGPGTGNGTIFALDIGLSTLFH